MKPHEITDKDLQGRLHAVVKTTIERLGDDDRSGMIYGIISRAAAFFAHCPEDFCVQHADWYDGHAVFGGTNRLLWSMSAGFRPDPPYCSPRFMEQFTGESWEKLGAIEIHGKTLVLIDSSFIEELGVVPKIKVPMSWNGTLAVYGRKSNKGDGKLAEVRINTGAEA